MTPSTKLGMALVRTLWVAGTGLAFVLIVGGNSRFQAIVRTQLQASTANNARGPVSTPVAAESPKPNDHWGITRYLMGFDGGRSLDVATAVEQVRTGYTRYTVRLQLSSGTDQSIAVIAPPGGLRPEVRDMTGDGIRNDLVLTPKLVHWPLTILVNDGHDHFLAISGALPGSWGADDQASGGLGLPSNLALRSSRFRADFLPGADGPFLQPLQQNFSSPPSQTASVRLAHASGSGRAPPLV